MDDEVRAVQDVATPEFATLVQLAATVGARRGTLVALRWGDVDLGRGVITFSRSIAESEDGTVEKGTKADRPYSVTLGPDTKEMLGEPASARRRAEFVGVPFGAGSSSSRRRSDALEPGVALARVAALQHPGRRGRVRLHDSAHGGEPDAHGRSRHIVVAERLGCTEANILRTYLVTSSQGRIKRRPS